MKAKNTANTVAKAPQSPPGRSLEQIAERNAKLVLAADLFRKKPRTIRELADKLEVALVTAYVTVDVLKSRGYCFRREKASRRAYGVVSGPYPKQYVMTKDAKR